ncbi:tetratricopeptide repeat protein [Deefgea tanakiae]|uniref:Tetratricopeptide repeat protein n=1 Tax=Deefgea tanakiae TaxID=2865840 RepID=A0ABX8Z565_9NEIS|nr:tetratricopeptide repeat protein [Deefgea tanakiae]QZA77718.1 tetratricopeptide repeat protein [Deefgea tanakiae]
MSLHMHSLLAVFIAGLTGCAALAPVAPVTAASAVAEAATEGSEVNKVNGYNPDMLPKVELSDELLMRFLVGDVAAQRGNPALGAQAWLDIANRTQDPRAAQRATQLALTAGQLALAQDAALLWVAGAPYSIQARQILVGLLIRSKRLDQVEPHLRVMLNAKPAEMAPFFMQMHQLWDKDADRAAVISVTEQLTEPHLNMPEAHFARAVAFSNASQDALALQELDAALKLRPSWEPAVLYKVQLLGSKDSVAVKRLLQDAAKANPKSSAISIAQARGFAENQNYELAQQQYEAALSQDPRQLEALVGAGLVALELRDLDKAQSYLERAVTVSPKSVAQLGVYLGQIAEQQHRDKEAIKWYLQVGEEQSARVKNRLPRLYAKTGQQAEADVALAALPVVTVDQQISKAQIEAQVWRERKDLARARDTITAAITQHPKQAELYYDRSLYLDMLGDIAGAEADLLRYLALNPDHVQGLNALGYILANRTDRLAEADTYLTKAITKDPNNPVILDSLGWLRLKQGKLKEALALLERAYADLPDPEVAAHYAEALWLTGDKSKAIEVLDAASLLDADDEALLATRKKLGM